MIRYTIQFVFILVMTLTSCTQPLKVEVFETSESGNKLTKRTDFAAGDSYILVETPLGKVISYGGIFSLKLEDAKVSTQRNAMISCYLGSLIFTDQRGVSHSLSDGNKMPIILKDNLVKVNIVKLDELEQRAVGNFNNERVNFIEADIFQKLKCLCKLIQ